MSPPNVKFTQNHPSSFRDPSGYVFESEGAIYRGITPEYSADYDFLVNSGLCNKLFEDQLLVRHSEVDARELTEACFFKVIKPDRIPLITYPYEWCFGQLKDAALLTLKVLKTALDYGMILKDASAFNVQFISGHQPIFIDTLSFSIYREGQPWLGYKQFCEHFLAPLTLMSYRGAAFQSLFKLSVDGVPLRLATQILPWYSMLKSAVLFHIHLHSKSTDFFSKTRKANARKPTISKRNLVAMIDHLYQFIDDLNLDKKNKTQWQDYDKETHYSKSGKIDKSEIVKKYVGLSNPKVVWDIGANDGYYSRCINDMGLVIAMDADPRAVENNYQFSKKNKSDVYPLVSDITNPSAGSGWANSEREPLICRSAPDLIMALAILHHLVITHNIPFLEIAKYFSGLAQWLIIEYVPSHDEKISQLPETAGKTKYTRENFEESFSCYYEIISESRITGSDRTILLLKKRI